MSLGGKCGGIGEAKPADGEVQQIAEQVRGSAEEKAGQKFGDFKAVSYATQVVAGMNYFIKVNVGADAYVHLRVYKTLPHAGSELSLTAIQTGKSLEDPLEYF